MFKRLDAAQRQHYLALLHQIAPFSGMPESGRHLAGQLAEVISVEAGATVCDPDDPTHRYVMLEGRFSLVRNAVDIRVLGFGQGDAGTGMLAPSEYGIRSESDGILVRFPAMELRWLLEREGRGTRPAEPELALEEGDPDEAGLFAILESPLVRGLTATGMQRLIAASEPVVVNAGDTIVEAGQSATHFYFVHSGWFSVTFDVAETHALPVMLELMPGDSFGEESLQPSGRYGCTVAAETAGRLLKLSREDAARLVLEPAAADIDAVTARARVDDGALVLDLRACARDATPPAHEGVLATSLDMLRRESLVPADVHEVAIVADDRGSALAAYAWLTSTNVPATLCTGPLDALDDLLRPPEATGIPAGPNTAPETSAFGVSTADLRQLISTQNISSIVERCRGGARGAALAPVTTPSSAPAMLDAALLDELKAYLRHQLNEAAREMEARIRAEHAEHEALLRQRFRELVTRAEQMRAQGAALKARRAELEAEVEKFELRRRSGTG